MNKLYFKNTLYFRNNDVKSYNQEIAIGAIFITIVGKPTLIDGVNKIINKNINANNVFKISSEQKLSENEFVDLINKNKTNVIIKVKKELTQKNYINTIEFEKVIEISHDENFLIVKHLNEDERLLKHDFVTLKDVEEFTEIATL